MTPMTIELAVVLFQCFVAAFWIIAKWQVGSYETWYIRKMGVSDPKDRNIL